jgi:hypothetical protein
VGRGILRYPGRSRNGKVSEKVCVIFNIPWYSLIIDSTTESICPRSSVDQSKELLPPRSVVRIHPRVQEKENRSIAQLVRALV